MTATAKTPTTRKPRATRGLHDWPRFDDETADRLLAAVADAEVADPPPFFTDLELGKLGAIELEAARLVEEAQAELRAQYFEAAGRLHKGRPLRAIGAHAAPAALAVAAEPQASGGGKSSAPPLGAAFQGEPRWVPWDGRSTTVRLAVPPAAEVAPDFPPAREGQWLRDINAELGTGAAHDEGTSAVAPGTPGPGPGHTTAEKAPGSAEPPAPAPPAGVDTTSAGPGVPSETSTGDGSGQAEADPLPVGKWDKPGKDGAQS